MSLTRNYDTVAFDVRENATMLFFARTTPGGDIDDYLLLMRTSGQDSGGSLYMEVNERQFGGDELIREAELAGNVLILRLATPIPDLGGTREINLAYDDTAENKASIEAGALRVLGAALSGGHA